MSFEGFAQDRLQKDLIGYRKNGLTVFLRCIVADRPELEGLEFEAPHFIPDGTRLRRQPAFNPRIEPWDMTVELWEIKDTCPLTAEKLESVRHLARDLYDNASVFTELWICDRYGLSRRKVYDVRDHIDSGVSMPDARLHEFRTGAEWVRAMQQA